MFTLTPNQWLTLLLSLFSTTSMILFIIVIARIKKRILMRDGKPYLIRWTIFKFSWGSLKVHKALVSDPADPHDHPWNYLSLILWGGYFEEQTVATKIYLNGDPTPEDNITKKSVWFGPGRLLYRRGDRLHRLIIPQGKTCTTLIFTTKKWREWGFMKGHRWVSNKSGTY